MTRQISNNQTILLHIVTKCDQPLHQFVVNSNIKIHKIETADIIIEDNGEFLIHIIY